VTGPSSRRFLDIDMPDAFELETPTEEGDWVVWGRYEASMFGRLEDGTYVCAGHGGSPLFLRCLRQDGAALEVVDGGGEHYRYRLRPVALDGEPHEHGLGRPGRVPPRPFD